MIFNKMPIRDRTWSRRFPTCSRSFFAHWSSQNMRTENEVSRGVMTNIHAKNCRRGPARLSLDNLWIVDQWTKGWRRLSARRKTEAVLRLLRGEDSELLSRGLGVLAAAFSNWCGKFLADGQEALRERPADERNREIGRLRQNLGETMMTNELFQEKISRMEAGRPLAQRSREDECGNLVLHTKNKWPGRVGQTEGDAASFIREYQRQKAERSSFFSAYVRTWSSKWPPRFLQWICCLFEKRLLNTWFSGDFAKATEIVLPFRHRSP